MGNVGKISNLIDINARRRQIRKERTLQRKQLVNRINYINFQDKTLQVNFIHPEYGHRISVPARPLPCLDGIVECRWEPPSSSLEDIGSLQFVDIHIRNQRGVLRFAPELLHLDTEGIRLQLPESGIEVPLDREARQPCRDIQAQLIQTSAAFNGALEKFNAVSFRIRLNAEPPQTFAWLNTRSPVSVLFSRNGEVLYSGECRIEEQRIEGPAGRFDMVPVDESLNRFDPREFRSKRKQLVPAPDIFFTHPLTGRHVQRSVLNVSGSGFSAEDDDRNPVLLPGLILPELRLVLANSFSVTCRAQVVYRRRIQSPKNADQIVCGIAFLDMAVEDHGRLLALLHHAENRKSYVCNRVDLDALWDFFFETGFIYPEKYAYILANKDRIKDTYERLYNGGAAIARHFTYQDKGRILGHIAMLRFYRATWLIHHHAGDSSASTRAGLDVLDQIGRYTYDAHRLYSSHMHYLICYFRPENKFPNRVFGRITRNINDPLGSSVDTFAYFHYAEHSKREVLLPDPWRLREARPRDLETLALSYRKRSGGLMLDALDLKPEDAENDPVSEQYRRRGFRRERHLFTVEKDGRPAAVIMANLSDIGLNLSDLTNCIQVFVIRPDALPAKMLRRALGMVSDLYERRETPVLVFPDEYPESAGLAIEKRYNLWVLNTLYSDHYFRHLKRLVRFVR